LSAPGFGDHEKHLGYQRPQPRRNGGHELIEPIVAYYPIFAAPRFEENFMK
jgi:hypothetical protein